VTAPTPGSRDVLLDREPIKTWADDHDAVPVWSQTESGVPVGFALEDDPDDDIAWEKFFTSFENGRLALLVDGSNFAFVDRDRVAETDDRSAEAVEQQRSERRRAEERHHDEVTDPHSEHRADEAADQENVDNHRDEQPFES
jgi:hypothetical protein